MSSNFYCIKSERGRSTMLALATMLTLALAAPAISYGQTPATSDWRTELPQSRKLGEGEFRWFGMSIYTAALWANSKPFDAQAPFALQLTYHRHIGAQRFVDTSIDEIRHLADQRDAPLSAEQLKKWESYLSRTFPDVSNGDQLIGVFIPGKGCRFYGSSRLLGEIDDPEFASAFFSIWLDPHSRDEDLREQLLGLKQ